MNFKDYNFHYYFHGNKNNPAILFLHGFMGNCHEFNEAIALLKDNFYCLTVELPGHGRTQILNGQNCYTMANTALALINLLDELKISKCFLIGYSMGGRLGLFMSLNFSKRFSKVVLESASPGLATESEQLERINKDNQIARKLERINEKSDFLAFLRNWYMQPIFGNIKYYPQFQNLLEMRLDNNPVELAKSLRMMGTGCQPSLWERLSYNQVPLLLLAGEYDLKFIDINQQMFRICKNCQLKVINNTAHNIHFENAVTFVKNVRHFFMAV